MLVKADFWKTILKVRYSWWTPLSCTSEGQNIFYFGQYYSINYNIRLHNYFATFEITLCQQNLQILITKKVMVSSSQWWVLDKRRKSAFVNNLRKITISRGIIFCNVWNYSVWSEFKKFHQKKFMHDHNHHGHAPVE